MKKICHQNIARILTSFTTNDGLECVTVMELGQSNLRNFFESQNKNKQKRPLPFETVLDFTCQMLCGLKHLHDNQIIHGNLIPRVTQ